MCASAADSMTRFCRRLYPSQAWLDDVEPMRNAFADEVTRLAKEDPRVMLLSGDIGNRLFDKLGPEPKSVS